MDALAILPGIHEWVDSVLLKWQVGALFFVPEYYSWASEVNCKMHTRSNIQQMEILVR